MPEPRPRTPAQIEASRRNGSRSHGPLTPEGKARASRNAVKHGLTAMTHLVVEGEDPAGLEALTFRMLVETGATSEIEGPASPAGWRSPSGRASGPSGWRRHS